MKQNWYRKSIWMLMIAILILVSSPSTQPTHAQSDEVLARIDQAMGHLSNYLDRTITRDSHFWQWAERVWDNEAMGCPVPGKNYEPQTVRGYRIRITVDDTVYDYRSTSDGSILLLCIGGQPDPTSIGVDTIQPTDPDVALPPAQVVTLANSTDWAWFYDSDQEILYLFNKDGLQTQLPRPQLTNEAGVQNEPVKLAVSRDGRYMVVGAQLSNSNFGLGIYSFESSSFVQEHEGQPNENIAIGTFGRAETLTFNAANDQVAIGFYKAGFEDQDFGWRIIVFELESGDPVYQLGRDDPILASLADVDTQSDLLIPKVVYFDDGPTIHVQMIPGFTEGTPMVDAFAWNPVTQTVALSPYIATQGDIDPVTDLMVWADQDTTLPILPAQGPFTSNNVVRTGLPEGFPPGPTTVWIDSTKYHFTARWLGGMNLIAFLTDDQNANQQWKVLDVTSNNQFVLNASVARVYGGATGFWTVAEPGTVAFHTLGDPISGNPLWQGDTLLQHVWSLPVNAVFGLTQILVPSADVTQPDVTGDSFCPGAPPSAVAVGMRARVTVSTDGEPLPLRMRQSPGGEFIQSIDEGTEFSIIGGPACSDGFTWWEIRLNDGATGWSAEGSSANYFMEPVEVQAQG